MRTEADLPPPQFGVNIGVRPSCPCNTHHGGTVGKRLCLLAVAVCAWVGVAAAQQRQITGRVTASGGGPVTAVNVSVAAKTRGG